MKRMIWKSKRRYFLYKVVSTREQVRAIIKRFKKLRYWIVKTYNQRTNKTEYAIYFDRMVSYY